MMASYKVDCRSNCKGNHDGQKDSFSCHQPVIVKSRPRKRYYVRYAIVPFEEDFTHEFKGHRNLCREDVPQRCYNPETGRSTRAPVSRALCAFLNTGKGGTVYLGITDDGSVKGIRLTLYQKDHVVLGLEDAFSRFNPPVPKHMWHLEFVPVVREGSPDLLKECSDDISAHSLNEPRRLKEHVFRTYEYCWCDKDALAQFNLGVLVSDYVIEITVHTFDSGDPRNGQMTKADLKLSPVYENEEGKAYFRRQASLFTHTVQEIVELTRQQVREHYQPIVDKLRTELYELRQGEDTQDGGVSAAT
ncbi:schlafen-like protein 2 [Ptychodera flava]|uniref:schlafen-like protein 2 n=1 Tax=Ptychodera flava TaxID=63121 RepID=UPI00396AA231